MLNWISSGDKTLAVIVEDHGAKLPEVGEVVRVFGDRFDRGR